MIPIIPKKHPVQEALEDETMSDEDKLSVVMKYYQACSDYARILAEAHAAIIRASMDAASRISANPLMHPIVIKGEFERIAKLAARAVSAKLQA